MLLEECKKEPKKPKKGTVFAPFSLEFDLDYKVSIEIQGLSIFKMRVNPVLCYSKKQQQMEQMELHIS